MIFQTQEILFFSLNNASAASFERHIRYTQKEFKKHSLFHLIRGKEFKPLTFNHFRQLFFFLEHLKLVRFANLIIIVDLYSLDTSKDDENHTLLKELVVQYPEVKIVFLSYNDDWIYYFKPNELKCNLENKQKCAASSDKVLNNEYICNSVCSIKFPYIHSFNPFEKNAFDLLVRGKINLFDASNLRNVIKQDFYKNIHVQANYPKSQCSRLNHFALAIDEEIILAYFNGYALYANGYRSMPIVSFLELNYLKENLASYTDKSDLDLIVRDYDLQFEDYPNEEKLFALRGIKWKGNEWESQSEFWENFSKNQRSNELIWFITRISQKQEKYNEPYIDNKYKFNKENSQLGLEISQDKKKAIIRGITKPINGIFAFHDIDKVRRVYKNSLDTDTQQINIHREIGGHSVSPFVFHIADSLIKRSQKYFDNKMFMLSALLAKEACEILNGFHFMMTLEALYLLAVAETSLETDALGIEEEIVADNTAKRLRDIRIHVERLCKGNDKAKKNVLTQIFNDIRHICREKEQFKAADIALAELINIRYGNCLWK